MPPPAPVVPSIAAYNAATISEDPQNAADQPTKWTEAEKERAIEAFALYGLDFNQVASHLGGKTPLQCRNFFNNNKKKFNLEKIVDDRTKKGPQYPDRADSDVDEGDKDFSRPESPEEEEKPQGKGDGTTKKKPRSQQPKERRPIAVWTNAEKNLIVNLLSQHGKNWHLLSQEVKTKTPGQIKNFFQNYKQKLNLGKVLPGTRERRRGSRADDMDDDDDDQERDFDGIEQVDMKEFEPSKVKKEGKATSKPPSQPPSAPLTPVLAADHLPKQLPQSYVSPLFSLAEISALATPAAPLPFATEQNQPPSGGT